MTRQIELLILPYDSQNGQSLIARLIAELRSAEWTRFRAAVAFLSVTGTFDQLLDALDSFSTQGRAVSITVGADIFGAEGAGSDYDAVKTLLDRVASKPNVVVNLYHERGRTFHPKVYLFDNESTGRALIVVGSSNLSRGGLANNVEVDLLVRLDRSDPSQWDVFERLDQCFREYWAEA
ncbi:MAG TPA: phospholipase D family protein [Thermoanaerobaculaceae bacterium]|nr:phospholipase D family protein [Thermoanaerobaculaceae bacterium]